MQLFPFGWGGEKRIRGEAIKAAEESKRMEKPASIGQAMHPDIH